MNNIKHFPLSQLSDLDTLDDNEMLEGYRVGLRSIPLPNDASRSYWHGWRNGMVDGKHMTRDAAQSLLAHRLVHERPEWVKGVFVGIDNLFDELAKSHFAPATPISAASKGK